MNTNANGILIDEWKDIRETLRYFGNKRFAQLTVFIAATGFLASNFVQQISLVKLNSQIIITLKFAGIVLGVSFLIMEWRSAQYIDLFAERGREIEDELGNVKLIHRRPTKKGLDKFFTGTYATYLIYVLAIVFWLFPFHIPNPLG